MGFVLVPDTWFLLNIAPNDGHYQPLDGDTDIITEVSVVTQGPGSLRQVAAKSPHSLRKANHRTRLLQRLSVKDHKKACETKKSTCVSVCQSI